MANLEYCPAIPLNKLDTTGVNAGEHIVYNSGTGEFEAVTDTSGLVTQPLLAANGAAVVSGLTPVDTSTLAITVNAPAAPGAGDCFAVTDATANAETNNITVDFGALNFNGSTGAFTVNCDGGGAEFCYVDVTTGWVKLS